MPTYVYEIIDREGRPGTQFEIKQRMTDPPLTEHPETGEPIRRVFQAPNLPGFKYDRAQKQIAKEDKSSACANCPHKGH